MTRAERKAQPFRFVLFRVCALFLFVGQLLAQVQPQQRAPQEAVRVSREEASELAAGKSAVDRRDLLSAELHFKKALGLSRQLPETEFERRAEALVSLAEVIDAEKRPAEAELLLKERLSILERHSKECGLLLGLGWFDLEAHFAATAQTEEAIQAAEHATVFYGTCIRSTGPFAVCDHRLADVQGIMGLALFNVRRFEESEEWLREVVERANELVRPEVLLASLGAWRYMMARKGNLEEVKRVTVRLNKLEQGRRAR